MNKGMMYAHEHVTIDLSGPKQNDDCHLRDLDQSIAEFQELYERGVRHVVEVTNRGMGRDTAFIQQVAEATGIQFICSTGYYKEPFLPEEVYRQSNQELVQLLVKEIIEGIDGSGIKANVIGEIGTSKEMMTPMEEKVFSIAAEVHKQTGKTIVTHTTLGTYGLEQIDFFRNKGVDLSRVVLSHIDLSGNVEYMKRLLDQGVTIAFDTIGKLNYQSDDNRAEWLYLLCEEGYSGQIVLSVDITRRSHLKDRGGIGYAYLLEKFVPMLKDRGISQASLDQMLITNPYNLYLK